MNRNQFKSCKMETTRTDLDQMQMQLYRKKNKIDTIVIDK